MLRPPPSSSTRVGVRDGGAPRASLPALCHCVDRARTQWYWCCARRRPQVRAASWATARPSWWSRSCARLAIGHRDPSRSIAIHRDRSCAATLARRLSHRGHCAAMAIVMATARGPTARPTGDSAASGPSARHAATRTRPSWSQRDHRDHSSAAILMRRMGHRGHCAAIAIAIARPSWRGHCGDWGDWHLSDCVVSGPSVSRAATRSGRDFDLNISHHRFSFTSCPCCHSTLGSLLPHPRPPRHASPATLPSE